MKYENLNVDPQYWAASETTVLGVGNLGEDRPIFETH